MTWAIPIYRAPDMIIPSLIKLIHQAQLLNLNFKKILTEFFKFRFYLIYYENKQEKHPCIFYKL